MGEETRRTPLYEEHEALGGKIVDFHGWYLPVQYKGIMEEHKAVRERAGLFDVSHMGEIELRGTDALKAVQHLIANNAANLSVNQVLYTPMCYPNGGVVDDFLVYRRGQDRFLLVVNASNTQKDYDWIKENTEGFDVVVENQSDKTGQVAIQGPRAQTILQKIYSENLVDLKFFWFQEGNIAGESCLVSRTGYTGEDGFEIYAAPDSIKAVFHALMEAGEEEGIAPCGLGARNTLRFEAALPLYGNELSKDITPLEARLKIFCDLEKDSFIGREALMKQREKGLERRLVGLEMLDKGIPREGYTVEVDGEEVGFVTSGSFSPTLEKNLGLAMLKKEFAKKDTQVQIRIRKRALQAKIVKLPFYKRGG